VKLAVSRLSLILFFLLLIFVPRSICNAQTTENKIQDPEADYAFLDIEPYTGFTKKSPLDTAEPRFGRIAGQLAFPAGKWGDHTLFGTIKSTWMNKDIVYHDTLLSDGILRRFWLSGGTTILNTESQSSLALMGVGLNSDMADLTWMDFNTEWLYIHNFKINPRFTCGLGLDVQQFFHHVKYYPLFFVSWAFRPKTKFKWDADYLEIRQFLTDKLTFTAGTRFNLEFFALAHDATYEYHSMGLETGFQYALANHFYVRLKYKELVWGKEFYGLVDGSEREESIAHGRSLRLNFTYGI